jgi:copper oxidase (laccase) domain-containing protein
MMVQSQLLSGIAGVRHAFFTRGGGVSNGIYASLNGGVGSKDDASHVAENRARRTIFFPPIRSIRQTSLSLKRHGRTMPGPRPTPS